jgi:probable F420-dependent oxidoreductase
VTKALRFSISVSFAGEHDARAIGRYGALAERLGFHSLLAGDHLYMGGRRTLHSVVTLSIVAAATERIGLGFCSYVLPLRNPLFAAKELAEIDCLSQGRLIAGVAAGSNAAEFATFGVPFAERGDRLDEGLEALCRLWSGEPVDFHGRFYDFTGAILAPTPAQQPHPPIWIGSWTGNRRSAERVVRYAAGWQASGLHTSVDEFRVGWARVQQAAHALGRDPGTIRTSYVNATMWLGRDSEGAWETANSGRVPGLAPPFPTEVELRLVGTPGDVIARLGELADAGVEEVAIRPPASAPEQLEIFAREIMPAFDSPRT